MDKAMNYVALAKKARLVELGEEPVGAVTRALKARLVIVQSRRCRIFLNGFTGQMLPAVPSRVVRVWALPL